MWSRIQAPERLTRLLTDPENAYWVRTGEEHLVDGGLLFPLGGTGTHHGPRSNEVLVSGRARLTADGNFETTAVDRAWVTATHGTVFGSGQSHMVLLKGADGHATGNSTFEAHSNSHIYPHHDSSGDVYDDATVHLQIGATGEVRIHNLNGVLMSVPYGFRAVYRRGKSLTVRLAQIRGRSARQLKDDLSSPCGPSQIARSSFSALPLR